ncbi:hypothetical protein YC2023_057813 [Brassica napus]
MGSCECGASPSWQWYTIPSGPTQDVSPPYLHSGRLQLTNQPPGWGLHDNPSKAQSL